MRLFLCEKPSQGNDIAKVIGASKRSDGCLQGSDVTVTWCIGHLLETAAPTDYDEAYKKWSLEQLPIIPNQWKVVVKKSTDKQFRVVKGLLAKASELVIATDADREGEMIAREMVDLCNYRGPIRRLWLSALNDASIRKALSSLRDEAETRQMYFSALGRSRADWLIGMNLSRLFTLLGRNTGYDGVLSIGRVQTPTLKLVVDRERTVKNFVPVPYWDVEALLMAGQAFTATWIVPDDQADDQGRCIQRNAAQQAAQAIQSAGQARVDQVEVKRVKEGPPLLFELGELQKVCSAKLGLGAQETLDIAQALYEKHKATTYPRVDCRYLPESMLPEVPGVLAAMIKTDSTMAQLVRRLDPKQRSRAWNDAKVTAHHGIIPTTEPANLAAMNDKERGVYDLVRRRYLMQFLPDYEYDKTDVLLSSGGQSLKASGRKIVNIGWKYALAGAGSEEEQAEETSKGGQTLPDLQQGLVCTVQSVAVKDRQTSPLALYTEGTLIDAMKNVAKLVTDPRLKAKLKETTGIGTNATRAGIIKGLMDKGLIVKKKQSLTASSAAHSLIDAIPKAISDPGTTAIWEQALDMIEGGQLTLDAFVLKQATWITQIVEKYRGTSLNIAVEAAPVCPLCGAATRKRSGQNGPFWGCSRYPDCNGIINIGSDKGGKKRKTAKKTG